MATPLPARSDAARAGDPRRRCIAAVTDADVSAMQLDLQRAGLESLSRDVVHQAVTLRASECAFHPVRDYLRALRWDGQRRVHGWLHTYLGAAHGEYAKQVGTMFLVAMVARVMLPGCKLDYMVVLEGPQGARKSSAARALGGEWFSDSLPDLGRDDVRVAQHLNGKWLIEIAEMSAMSKAESAALKAFITRPEEVYTKKYGRLEVREPRQCVFIGTTNEAIYLRDATGARRFWPVKVGAIDTDALLRDRDQLFAETVHLFDQGNAWWPDGEFEQKHIAPEQEARFEADAWEEPVREYLDGGAAPMRVTVMQVAENALKIEKAKFGTNDQRRLATVLERLGWARGNIAAGGDVRIGPGFRGDNGERFWVRKPADASDALLTHSGVVRQVGSPQKTAISDALTHPDAYPYRGVGRKSGV